MSRLTHLARADHRARILRGGIKASRIDGEQVGVYAMPVLSSFFISHQWQVLPGHYASELLPLTAAEAEALIMHADDPRGYQIVVMRGIEPTEIKRTRAVRQVVGWRYKPNAHGVEPCPCPLCLPRGSYGAREIRRKFW